MRILTFILLLLLLPTSPLHAKKVTVGNFSNNDLSGWKNKEFDGKTSYEIAIYSGIHVLASSSTGSASGIFKKQTIGLNKTPILNWSWKIKQTLGSVNEQVKAGDDYAARIYIVFSDGPFFWQTKTLNYVWANHARIEEHWPNPYTNNAQMLAIQTGDKKASQWQTESRNVLKDIKTVFGKEVFDIEAIAIMTDTDQTGLSAQAWFSDIWFSDQ